MTRLTINSSLYIWREKKKINFLNYFYIDKSNILNGKYIFILMLKDKSLCLRN